MVVNNMGRDMRIVKNAQESLLVTSGIFDMNCRTQL